MDATFKLDGCTRLRIGNNIQPPDSCGSGNHIGLMLEREPPTLEGRAPTEYQMLAYLKPHEARAMASVLLSAATEAK